MNSNTIQAWDVSPEDFPTQGSVQDKILFVLSFAILAPSTHNSQPWKFQIKDDSCYVYYDEQFKLPYTDPTSRDLYVSMGAMLTNLKIASQYFGIWGDMRYLWQGNLIAQIRFNFDASADDNLSGLLQAMLTRVNVRGKFDDRPIDINFLKSLFASLDNGEVVPYLINDKHAIAEIGDLTVAGLHVAHANKNFRREMSQWMHNNFTRKQLGLPGYSLRMPMLLSFVIPSILPYVNMGMVLGKLNRISINSSPAIGIIASDQDNPRSWLQVGEVFERINLELERQGMGTSVYVASIEMGNQREALQSLVSTRLLPQFLFCIGFMSRQFKHTPRLPLESKIIS